MSEVAFDANVYLFFAVIAVSYDSKNVGIQFVYMEKAQIIYRLLEDSVVLKRPGILLRWFEMECDSAG